MSHLVHPTGRRRGAVAFAVIVAVLASPSVAAAEPVRGLTVYGGYDRASGTFPVLFGTATAPPSPSATTTAVVSAYETALGSTVTKADATTACVSVRTAVTETKGKKTTTTTQSDHGCGSLSVTGLGAGIVDVTGTVPSDSGAGTLSVQLRAIAGSAQVAVPFQPCASPSPPYTSVCPAPGIGVRRHASATGTVTSDALGAFDLGVLGGPTYVWDIIDGPR